jgi:hypothetical protein
MDRIKILELNMAILNLPVSVFKPYETFCSTWWCSDSLLCYNNQLKKLEILLFTFAKNYSQIYLNNFKGTLQKEIFSMLPTYVFSLPDMYFTSIFY